MAGLRLCRSALRWQRVGGRRRKTRGCPLASCTSSSCRLLRGVACQNLRKKERSNAGHPDPVPEKLETGVVGAERRVRREERRSFVGKGFDAGEFVAAEEFEGSTAAG